ncbi:MAG: YggT family protein [Zoogloeaceae bacterium]|jgi:YggT family protein|nr:YggT family protein [Zoogloeaceae bacterium]
MSFDYTPFVTAFLFLIKAVCGFFSMMFILRLLLQWRRISFNNPLGGFVLKLTNWAVLPLRRLIPGSGGIDWASIIAAFFLQLVFFSIALSLRVATSPALSPLMQERIAAEGGWAFALFTISLVGLFQQILYLLILILILQAVLSWVNPYSPFAPVLRQLTAPILAPIQRVLPPISGIDLSPLVVILLLQAILMLL